MKKCFIVCPIGAEESPTRKRSDTLFKHVISPVCDECLFEPVRIDLENTNGSLNDEIINHLRQDDLVIADLTEHNPNAFYEVGFRAALGKPSIHLMSKDSYIPFDVSSIRTFQYDLSNLDSVEEVKSRLIKTINNMPFDQDQGLTTIKNFDHDTFNLQLLQEIYKVQDSITKLSATIEAKDSAAVSVLADKLAGSSSKTTEASLMEALMPTLLDNPERLLKLAEIADKFPKK